MEVQWDLMEFDDDVVFFGFPIEQKIESLEILGDSFLPPFIFNISPEPWFSRDDTTYLGPHSGGISY